MTVEDEREPNTWHAAYRYERSRFAEFGAITTVGERLVCHECGRDYLNLQTHVFLIHGMTAAEYRTAWGLPYHTLQSKSIHRKLSTASLANGSGPRLAKHPKAHRFKAGDPFQRMGIEAAAKALKGQLRSRHNKGLHATAHRLVHAWRAGAGTVVLEGYLVDLEEAIEVHNRSTSARRTLR